MAGNRGLVSGVPLWGGLELGWSVREGEMERWRGTHGGGDKMPGDREFLDLRKGMP